MELKNNKKNFYTTLISLLTKHGNKSLSSMIVHNATVKAAKKLNISCLEVLRLSFNNLCIFTEIKNIKQRKRIRVVPRYLSYNRRLFISTKLLLDVIKASNFKMSIEEKLTEEFIFLIKSPERSKSFLKKLEHEKVAIKHKSSSAFRW